MAWPVIRNLLGLKDDAAASTKTIRKSKVLADNYALVTLGSAVMQVAGIYYAWPALPKIKNAMVALSRLLFNRKVLLSLLSLKGPQRLLGLTQTAAKPALSNDGEWLLLIDMLGVLVTAILIIVVDGIVDEWILHGGALAAGTQAGKVKEMRTKRRVARVHGKRSLLKDVGALSLQVVVEVIVTDGKPLLADRIWASDADRPWSRNWPWAVLPQQGASGGGSSLLRGGAFRTGERGVRCSQKTCTAKLAKALLRVARVTNCLPRSPH